MPNRHKEKRNAEIVGLFDDGLGMLQKEIAAQYDMTESAVSMVILRDKRRKQAIKEAEQEQTK